MPVASCLVTRARTKNNDLVVPYVLCGVTCDTRAGEGEGNKAPRLSSPCGSIPASQLKDKIHEDDAPLIQNDI